MIVICEGCGQKGTVDEHFYAGKKLRLRCPHCSYDFFFAVPLNGNHRDAAGISSAAQISVDAGSISSEEAPSSASGEKGAEPAVLEAKRIARLIVSEIRLYNQEKLAKAETRKEVLELLRGDLMRGRQHYNSRIASKLPVGPDYFMESVKEILLTGKS